jgi:alkane 1-monooxygenase
MAIANLYVQTTNIEDRDRFWGRWALGLLVPTLPLYGLLFFSLTKSTWFLFFTPVVVFVAIPIYDVLAGTNDDNLSAEAEAEIEHSRFYWLMVAFYVPIQYITFAVAVWWFMANDPNLVQTIGLAMSVGIVGGIAIAAAHELGHKTDTPGQWLARIALAQSAYGHFTVEHNRGHHRRVATPEDPASARYMESFWAFFPRTVIFSLISGWRLEAGRLRRAGRSPFHWTNRNILAWILSVILFSVTIAIAGPSIIFFLIAQAIMGFFLLEVVNYVEHYGLLRQKQADGNYEKCGPEHSWNSNFKVTNVFLYHLQRHSDHHAYPQRPYQVLRNIDGSPNLPAGYAAMVPVAIIPPLWFWIMNPRLKALYEGDLSRANLSRRQRARLEARATA